MTMLARAPRPQLRPFVRRVWASTSPAGASPLERVAPTGAMHVVLRFSREPLTVFDDERGRGARVLGHAHVGGARASAYFRSIAAPSSSVGVQLVPGAGPLLFGASACAFAETHTLLEDVWGRDVELLRERLAEAASPAAQLDVVEGFLVGKLSSARGLDAVVIDAASRLAGGARVDDAVAHSGYSHRALLARFRDAVGLSPKSFARVVRAQRALALFPTARSLVAIAADAGYADQAHFTRELSAITGLAPRAYRAACPDGSSHVPVK